MVLVIGIGNPFRRDDSVGTIVAGRIAALGLPGVTVKLESGEGAALMQLWSHFDTVVIVDALRRGANPGGISLIDAREERIPTDYFHYSSHAFGVAEAIEVARALEQLPERLYVVGIEGAAFSSGSQLTPQVSRAVPEAVDELLQLLESCGVDVAAGNEAGS